jgi:PKD repeat protein
MRKNKMKNKSIIIILTAFLFTSVIAVESINSQQNGTIVSIENITIEPSKLKSARILIHNINNLGSFKVSISYDTTILNVAHVDNCEVDEIFSYKDTTKGVLNITGYNISAITSGLICIAEIVFKAVGSDGDSCDLVIEDSELLSADPTPIEIPHETDNGMATIKAGSSDGGGGGDGGNIPPIADASSSETTGYVGTPVNFDGSASYDPDGPITNFSWDFGDGKTGYGSIITHIYTKKGTFSVTLRVRDNAGATDDDIVQVVISQPNIPPVAPDVDGPQSGRKNTVLNYTVVSTDEDGDDIQYIFDWGDDTIIYSDFVDNGTVVTESHSWSMWGVYSVMVKAFDNMSESGASSFVVLIDVIWVKDIGYLIDTDSDGVTYEKFYSNETGSQTDPAKLEDGSYRINSDADADDDWIYDPQTDTLTPYAAPSEKKEEQDNSLLYAFIIIVIIILIIISVAVGRKPKSPKKSKSKEK